MQKSPLYFHIIILVFFWLFPFFSTTLFSQKKNSSVHNSWEIKPFERKAFIENKGQFESYLPSGKKDFTYCIDKGYQVFFYQNEITYLFTKHARSKGTILNIFETEEKREERKHNFNTEQATYELINPDEHHDHLICIQCHKVLEFLNENIEQLQKDIAINNNFKIVSHSLNIYGICNDCTS